MKSKNKAVVLVKVQASSGVDSVPTNANAFLVEDPSIEPITKKLERNNVKPHYGSKGALIIGEGYKIGFSVELSGIGGEAPVLTTPPAIGTLLRGCYMTQTVVATPGSECVKYTPHDDIEDAEELSIYFFQDNRLHKAIGCIGTWALETKVNEYAKFKFEFTGIYDGPAEAAVPVIANFVNETVPPVFRSALFTIDTYAAVIESLKIDLKGEVTKRSSANADTGILKYFMKERQMTAEIDPEVPAIADKDFWAMWEAAEDVAMTATIGQTAGNRCVITCPVVQIDDVKYADRENILTYGMPLRIKPTAAGNDEIELKFN